MELTYTVLDVFTDRPLAGNPLAVVHDGRGLGDRQMQAVAREFNLSETVFLLSPNDAACVARLRIFAPMTELPFAGHPMIGTAVHLGDQGTVFGRTLGQSFALETGIGPVSCATERGPGGHRASLVNTAPLEHFGTVAAPLLADCLGIDPSMLRKDTHAPVLLSKGVPYAVVELADAAALAACLPDSAAFARAEAQHATGQSPFAVYAYVRHGEGDLAARMFDPLAGIPEDPATGSAAVALAAYLADLTGEPLHLNITQGVEMGRPSRLQLHAHRHVDGTSEVQLAGAAVEVMRGTLRL